MRVLFDNTLGLPLARAFSSLFHDTHEVVHLRDRFGPGTSDKEWLDQLGAEGGWIVLTHDRRILTRPAEVQAYKRAGVKLVVLVQRKKKWPRLQQLTETAKLWPNLVESVHSAAPGSAFRARRNGEVKRIP